MSSIPNLINRNRFLYFGIILFVIALGLGSRTAVIPDFIYPYLGDFLYALMMYFLVAFLFPKMEPKRVGLIAVSICFAIEFLQIYQAPWINEIRETRIGALTLGSGFLWSDLVCYTLGGALGFGLERVFFRNNWKNGLFQVTPVMLLLTISCDISQKHYVQFEEPQPVNVKQENKIAKSWRGTYHSINSNRELVIDEQRFVKKSFMHLKGAKAEMQLSDSLQSLSDSAFFEILNAEFDEVRFEKDTFYMTNIGRDTLFEIAEDHILKKMKRMYFLNTPFQENWVVKCIEKHGDSLFLGAISPGDTLLELDFVQKVEQIENTDTSYHYVLDPSKRQLKNLVKQNRFETTECFVKGK